MAFPVVSFVLAFPQISYTHSSSPPFVLHALSTSSSLTYHSNYTWRKVQVMKLLFFIAVTTPALVGICLGATLFLVTVAAVTCFCYRRHSKPLQGGKKGVRGGPDKPLALQQHRRPTAVKSPAGSVGTHYLKKSPSPTGGARSPPGVSPETSPSFTFCIRH